MDTTVLNVSILSSKLLLASVFSAAALVKFSDLPRLRGIISSYDILPAAFVGAATNGLPLLELGTAVLIILPMFSNVGIVLAAGLLTLYIAVLASAAFRKIKLKDCGCGGFGRDTGVSRWTLVRNGILLSLAIVVLHFEDVAAGIPVGAWAVAVPFSGIIVLLYWITGGLWANRQTLSLIGTNHE